MICTWPGLISSTINPTNVIKMEITGQSRTTEEYIPLVFRYAGMPDQSHLVNGSGNHLSDIGKTLNQLFVARDQYSSGDIEDAERTLTQLITRYSILREQLSFFLDVEGEEMFETVVGERGGTSTITNYVMGRLKTDINQLDTAIKAEQGNINKSGQEPKNGGVDFVLL